MTALQIRQARAILKWQQQDPATTAGIPLEAVMMAEGVGPRVVPLATTAAIVRAFKTAGIELSAPSGLRFVAPGDPDDAD